MPFCEGEIELKAAKVAQSLHVKGLEWIGRTNAVLLRGTITFPKTVHEISHDHDRVYWFYTCPDFVPASCE